MAEKKTTVEEIKDYSSMKKAELLALAKDMGAKVNTKTRKADIIAAIEAIENESEVEATKPAEEKAPKAEAVETAEAEAKASPQPVAPQDTSDAPDTKGSPDTQDVPDTPASPIPTKPTE